MRTINTYRSFQVKPFLLVMIAFAMLLHSCEQFELDETPGKSSLAVEPYNSIEELDLAVTGIFGKLNKAAWMTTFYVNGWSGDDMTTHRESNKGDFREYDQRDISASNGRTATNWAGIYAMVKAANTVLINMEGVTFPADAARQEELVGQTYFLRGLMFYHLARIHGRIVLPLDLEINFERPLATQAEVYQQIESDLLNAESMLPVQTNIGASNPNSGTARAILARLYLDWAGFPEKDASKYALAASSAKQVIDNAGDHGFGLVDDISTLYTVAGRENIESIFTIAYCSSCGLPNRKTGKLGLPSDPQTQGWQETFAEIRFFEDMPEGARKDATYHTQVPLDENDQATAGDPVGGFLEWTSFVDQQQPLFKKIVGPFEEGTFGGFESDRNDYYMRYAEVLLIYAEASGESGTAGAAAWKALNDVRNRAGLPDVGPSDGTIQDLAFTERKWELAGEYLRWNDLIRKEQVEAALGGSARNPRVSINALTNEPITSETNAIIGSLAPSNYFVPLPQTEVDRNPNLAN
ncbi:RagB/SusD family nutrient uptake outer membrane protein [Cellulophaga baltica]|uniref:RagB/SusD family nutrient uptake outer membrane protein n=1 Tax=Cellulophaga baltica TaxID=76594 RepID=UPI0037C8A002